MKSTLDWKTGVVPEPEKTVLVLFRNGYGTHVFPGFWESGRMSEDASCYSWDESEFEKNLVKHDKYGSFLVPKGWYLEGLDTAEMLCNGEEVIAWADLPDASSTAAMLEGSHSSGMTLVELMQWYVGKDMQLIVAHVDAEEARGLAYFANAMANKSRLEWDKERTVVCSYTSFKNMVIAMVRER